jgi:ATP-binding cassette, subfamily F, member 3
MLTVTRMTKSFGGRVLFENASLQVNRGDCIALIGPNGAGKSTLLRILLGEEDTDEGEISLQRGVTIGYLPQESAPAGEESVLELASHAPVGRLAPPSAPEPGALQPSPAADSADFQTIVRAKRVLAGLSFRQEDFERTARTLSGGWIMRAHLARLLVQEPDLLLLDEPTNHLDLESLLWLQEYLGAYPGAILLISHDRAFLNALAGQVIEVANTKLTRYVGNYDEFARQKVARVEQQLAAYKNQQREIRRLQTFVDRFGAKATKASQAQSKLKQIERMEIVEAPDERVATVSFRFPQPARSGRLVIRLEEVHQAYGSNVVYSGLNFEAERGQRTVLVGPNGAGKSTLIKLLAGTLPIQRGQRELGHNVQVGYFSQQRAEVFDLSRSVLAEARAQAQASEQTARTLLGAFLFRGDDVFKPVGVLSGGEKTRLALARMLLNPPNLLLMDEPTTHLDMASIDALIAALQQFEGTLLFISHDLYFIRAVATSVLHVRAGTVALYPGDYDYYVEKTAVTAEHGITAGAAPGTEVKRRDNSAGFKSRERKRLEAEERNAQARRRREIEARFHTVESEILLREQRQTELLNELETLGTSTANNRAKEIHLKLARLRAELESLTPEWDRLAHELVS